MGSLLDQKFYLNEKEVEIFAIEGDLVSVRDEDGAKHYRIPFSFLESAEQRTQRIERQERLNLEITEKLQSKQIIEQKKSHRPEKRHREKSVFHALSQEEWDYLIFLLKQQSFYSNLSTPEEKRMEALNDEDIADVQNEIDKVTIASRKNAPSYEIIFNTGCEELEKLIEKTGCRVAVFCSDKTGKNHVEGARKSFFSAVMHTLACEGDDI
jgi:hypothetical protein